MRFEQIRLIRELFVMTMTLALLGSVELVSGQTVDVTGTWNLEVTTDQGVTRPSFTLTQEGERLSGSYSSEALGEARLRGTVTGSQVRIRFTVNLQGQTIGVTYRGTVDETGAMSGTIDLADGLATGRFTATRSGL